MPYKLVKHRNSGDPGTYWVVNTETKKRHSLIPLDRSVAIKQMRALYAAEGKEDEFKEPKVKKKYPNRAYWPKGSPEALAHMEKMRAAMAEKRLKMKNKD
jgi:hypothetical protein